MKMIARTLRRKPCWAGEQCLAGPHPGLMARLKARFLELKKSRRLPESLSFEEFYIYWRSKRRGENLPGLDDGNIAQGIAPNAPQPITRPPKQLQGCVPTIVLLVDFDDLPASTDRSPSFYEQMLFGESGEFATGSMREFYRNASNFNAASKQGIDVQGKVHGWFRMPKESAFYSNGASGTGNSFPKNAQGLARDAVLAALEAGVSFDGYDVLEEGQLTALFVIHAGRGAEETGSEYDIWSHKWQIPGGVKVLDKPRTLANTYLTVSEDCRVGVCAHEWGHLAARWADYYDTGQKQKSSGLGSYCLMAAGSWGEGGLTPTLPTGMLREFHQWTPITDITSTTKGIKLQPASDGGGVVKIWNSKTMNEYQYVLVEYRRKTGQDRALPDEGIAIYVVDEAIDNVNDEKNLAVELMQADGRRHLGKVHFGNPGDPNDLYPSLDNSTIGEKTLPPLNLPNGSWTGIEIQVLDNPGSAKMTIDVTVF